MKNILKLLFLLFTVCGCNDDFMERLPLDKQTVGTVFTTNENFMTYMWKYYSNRSFILNNVSAETYDALTDNTCDQGSLNSINKYAWDKVVVPTTDGGWTFGTIRGINLMLDNIEGSKLTENQKKHWRSVGYFFKSLEYFYLLSNFGDVCWLEHYITDEDLEIMYAPRMPRKEIANKILEMLTYAQENIAVQDDGPNTINKDCVDALMSRFGLFEGTWQKYHALSSKEEYEKYLSASFDASTRLMGKYPTIMSSYDAVFNSKDLAGQPGIILYRVNLNTVGYGHLHPRYVRARVMMYNATADLVQSYLCTDGKPIWTSSVYEGDQNTGNALMNVEFRNRDRRLYYTIVPPYKGNDSNNKPLKGRVFIEDFRCTDDPEDSRFINLMNDICMEDKSEKLLPMLQWEGVCVSESPHIDDARYNMSQVFCNSRSGYYVWKYYNTSTSLFSGLNADTDLPIFRMGEILINHAEVAFELGKFDQSAADATINKLRKRAHVSDMKIAEINSSFDPKRDDDVDPVLWEIRRERRVELMAEGFRLKDIRRWKKGEYLNKIPKGVYLSKTDLEDNRHQTEPDITKFSFALDGKDSGRIIIYGTPKNPEQGTPKPGWNNKYYLEPLPIEDLVLNEKLEQNPGYPRTNAE
ncbi:RagB/SusD family nutrient uptake outer membrane protein [Bacteroides fragilis]|nr:RagB/SusD family nutrient uptake outer membrane protein [Bacteroides fragilis]